MSSDLVFRHATTGDVAAIVSLVEQAYRGAESRKGWTTEADLLDGQRTDAEEIGALVDLGRSPAQARFLLALRMGELAGSVLLSREHEYAYLGMLAVRPERQGQGIGGALLAEAERVARDERLGACLRMTVIGQRSELLAWYERRGFRRTGERAPFPYGEPRFGLPRRPDLYFEVLEKALPR